MHDDPINPFDPAEPRRDEELGALLRQVTGDVPVGDVNWDALAMRISRAIPSRTVTSTWRTYAESWERRLLPLALAASLVGALALWNSSDPAAVSSVATVAQVTSTDLLSDIVAGAPSADVALRYARTVTSEMTIADAGTQ